MAILTYLILAAASVIVVAFVWAFARAFVGAFLATLRRELWLRHDDGTPTTADLDGWLKI